MHKVKWLFIIIITVSVKNLESKTKYNTFNT